MNRTDAQRQRPCVLVLDDLEADTLKTAIERFYFDKFGEDIEVLAAETIYLAEYWLSSRDDIDVCVFDVFVPDGDPAGARLALEIKDRFPVILISAHPRAAFVDSIRGSETLLFHAKPVDINLLVDQIQTLVSLKRSSDAA